MNRLILLPLLLAFSLAEGRDYVQEYVELDGGEVVFITGNTHCDGANRSSLWAVSWAFREDGEETVICYRIDNGEATFTLKDGRPLGKVPTSRIEQLISPLPCIGCRPDDSPSGRSSS